MDKKFFVKASRHSKEEKKLVAEITELIKSAEKNKNSELLEVIRKHPEVNNAYGLRTMLETIQNYKSGGAVAPQIKVEAPVVKIEPPVVNVEEKVIQNEPPVIISPTNSNNKDENNMTNKNQGDTSRSSSPAEEVVQFEEVTEIGKESQFKQPVQEREDEFAKYRDQQDAGGGGKDNDDAGGAGGGGGDDDDGGFEPPQDNGDSGGGDEPPESPDGNLKDIPDDTKRKAIKKTSEIVAKIYAGVLPMLPKLIAKVPEAKLERMVWADEIDPKMKLDLGEGQVTTVAGYVEGYNTQLDEQLVITPEQQKDFQDALKDVLEEKQVAMTPSQRLVTVVVAQTFTLMAMGIQNSIMMRKHFNHWKEIHEERKQANAPKKSPPTPPNPPASSTPPPTPPTPPTPPAPKEPVTPSANGGGAKNHHVENAYSDVQDESDEISIKPEEVQE